MSTDGRSEPAPRKRRLVTQLWFLVLVAIAAGIVFGLVAPEPAKDAKWLADAFIDRIMSEGRALTSAIGNSVATMVIAGWQGERDDKVLQRALADPTSVDEAVERSRLKGTRRRPRPRRRSAPCSPGPLRVGAAPARPARARCCGSVVLGLVAPAAAPPARVVGAGSAARRVLARPARRVVARTAAARARAAGAARTAVLAARGLRASTRSLGSPARACTPSFRSRSCRAGAPLGLRPLAGRGGVLACGVIGGERLARPKGLGGQADRVP
jgi:hypothetical protein